MGIDVKQKLLNKRSVFVPVIDNFLKNLMLIYLDKYGNHRECLVFCPLDSYVAKANREIRTHNI